VITHRTGGKIAWVRHDGTDTQLAPTALAWVAAGKRAAYVTDGGELSCSVHFAAGIAVCRAAGCVVTGIDGGPVGQAGRGLVVAASAETHGRLMSMIDGRS
jgi:myo-inositol-1(or 4)-monophosphatase